MLRSRPTRRRWAPFARPWGFFFADEARGIWRIEGVRDAGVDEARLQDGLALAALVTGIPATLGREATEAEGWLARAPRRHSRSNASVAALSCAARIRPAGPAAGRLVLMLDAGLAFGSGEHGSTRGCLRALESVARRRPRRILDLGTGSGILAMAAALLLRRPVLATDIEPWSVRVAGQNAAANGVGRLVRPVLANGWRGRAVRAAAPYDLVLANILARPLCAMARDLALGLAPGGTAILAGLLDTQMQARMLFMAHRRQGLAAGNCAGRREIGRTMVLRKAK